MKHLQSRSKHLLDRYLTRVRMAVAGSGDPDTFEIERDVRDHIEMALEGVPEPVPPSAMGRVLKRLGSPSQWVRDVESTLIRDSRNAEDWRLAYLSFALVMLALALPPFLWIGLFGAFLCARASLCSGEAGTGLADARGWLRLPALLVMYAPMIAIALLWPAIAVRLLADAVLEHDAIAALVNADVHDLAGRIAAIRLSSFDPVVTARLAVRSGHYLVAPVGAWLVVLGLFTFASPRPVAFLLRPFVTEGSHRFSGALVLGGLLLCAFALLHGLLKLAFSGAFPSLV